MDSVRKWAHRTLDKVGKSPAMLRRICCQQDATTRETWSPSRRLPDMTIGQMLIGLRATNRPLDEAMNRQIEMIAVGVCSSPCVT